jgi:uncharacterized membrane protein
MVCYRVYFVSVRNILIAQGILKILGTNVHKNVTKCHAQQRGPSTFKVNASLRGQNVTWYVAGCILCSVYNFFMNQVILRLLGTDVYNNKMCYAQHPDRPLPQRSWSHLEVKAWNGMLQGMILSRANKMSLVNCPHT